MLRETRTRFGRSTFGFLWALLEPLIFIGIFIMVRTVVREAYPSFGESIVIYVASGVIVFRFYSAIAGRTLAAISSNLALMAYPVVHPPDLIVARALLETVTMVLVMVVFWGMLSLIEEHRVIYHPVTLLVAMGVTTFLAWGIGIFNAVLSRLVPTWQRIHSFLQLPLFIGSGIFYLPVTMPEEIKAILAWNPVLHCVEWVRTGIYLDYLPLLDRPYPIVFGAVALVLGLGMERLFRREIMMVRR